MGVSESVGGSFVVEWWKFGQGGEPLLIFGALWTRFCLRGFLQTFICSAGQYNRLIILLQVLVDFATIFDSIALLLMKN